MWGSWVATISTGVHRNFGKVYLVVDPLSIGNPERRIPTATRRAVIERDGLNCQRCGRTVSCGTAGEPYRADMLHIDHLIPWASGGDHSLGNLIVCCADCNLRRSKPQRVVRSARIGVEYRNGTYYWNRSDFTPPKRLRTRRDGYCIETVCDYFGITVGDVLHGITDGLFPASSGRGPIAVGIPRYLR